MPKTKNFLSTVTYSFLVSNFFLSLFFTSGGIFVFLFSLAANIFSYKDTVSSLPSLFLLYLLGILVFFFSLICIFVSDKIAEYYNIKWAREYGTNWLAIVSLITLVLIIVVCYIGTSTLQIEIINKYWS